MLCFSIYQSNQCLISISSSNNGLSIWQFVSMYVIHQHLFLGAGTGIYPYAATQLYTRLKGNHGIVVLSGHEFPYPPSQLGITNLSLDETFWLIYWLKSRWNCCLKLIMLTQKIRRNDRSLIPVVTSDITSSVKTTRLRVWFGLIRYKYDTINIRFQSSA